MSISIKKQNLTESDKILLDKINWGFNEYTPCVYAKLVYSEDGFEIEFVTYETNPLREKTKHFEEVSHDSCVEFFANFDPENSNEYINFEVNANGVMRADIRTDRYNYKHLSSDDINSLGIKAQIGEKSWSAGYKISESLLKKYYPGFSMDKCKYIMGNFYKCGSKTKIRHYLTVFELKCEKPDFHRPEYFGKINLI